MTNIMITNMEVLGKWKIANLYRNSKLRIVQSVAQSLQQLPDVFQDHNFSVSSEKLFAIMEPLPFASHTHIFVSVLSQTFSSSVTTHLENSG